MALHLSSLLSKSHIGYATGIGSGMTWGLDTVLIGLVMTLYPFVNNPLLLVSGVFVCSMLHDTFAALWMLIIEAKTGELKQLWGAMKSKDGLFCMLGALFGGPLAMSFYMMAISVGGAALTATVTACYPLLGSVMAVIILKEKIQLRGWIGLLICIAGIVIIGYSPSGNNADNVLQGLFLSMIAAIGWATEAVVCGYGMKAGNVSPRMALLIRELTSAVVYMILVVPIAIGGYYNMLQGIYAVLSNYTCWLLLLFTALIGMSSFLMWYTAINNIGAAKALCLNVTYSLWAVVFSLIILQTTLTPYVVIGAICIVSGVAVSTLIKRKK